MGQDETRLQDAGVDALAPQLEQRSPHQFWSCGEDWRPSSCGQSLPRALETLRGTDPGCSRCWTAVLDQLGSPSREGKGGGPKAQAGEDLWLQPGSWARFLGRGVLGGLGCCVGEDNGTPLQYSCLENPMEPDGLQSMGSLKIRHD